MNNIAIFAGSNNYLMTKNICDFLQVPMSDSDTNMFPDTEIIVEIKSQARGKDCFVIQSTSRPVNDSLMELLIFIDCLKRASAKTITAVIPYYGYARQDRKDKGRTPITAKLIADMLGKAGADRILTVDLHAKQIEGFFNIPVDHLTAAPVFIRKLRREDLNNSIVLSPDVGNVKSASRFADELGLDISIVHKRRKNAEEVEPEHIIGDVDGKDVLMFDDMISTAGTMCSAAKLAVKNGAKSVRAFATHGLFVGPAYKRLDESPINEITVTNSILLDEKVYGFKNLNITMLPIDYLIGEAILRIYQNRSVSVLLESGKEYDMR